MFCRNRCSHCKSLTFYCILAQPMLHFCSIPDWTYQETFSFWSPPLPLEVTVSANLLVGRHQSFVLQNTNLLPLCSCKERSALLMQRRCQINAWRGGLYNGSCCKAGWWSAPCIHRVNEVKYWKSLAVFFRIRESRMWRISHAVFLKPNLTFYVHKAFSPPINGKHWLSPPSMKMWHAMFPAMHQITKQLWSNIIIYYILNDITNSYVVPLLGKWNRADDTGLGTLCPLSLYIGRSYCSLRCLIATTEC